MRSHTLRPGRRREAPLNAGVARTKLLIGCAAIAFTLGGSWAVWAALPRGEDQAKTKSALPEDIGFEPSLDSQLPTGLTFHNEMGEEMSLGDVLSDRPAILNLVYFRCPMLCNLSMDALVRTLNTMQLRVAKDFDVATVSFDPREGPELAAGVKRTVLKRYGASSADGWHFLTGDQPSIVALTKAAGFRYTYDEQSNQYAHAAGLLILTPEGRISRYLAGVDYAARDLRLGLVEASEGRVGTPIDQALLLCYRYDPLSGKYGLAISRAIKLLGLLTVATLAGSVAWMLRRDFDGETPTSENE